MILLLEIFFIFMTTITVNNNLMSFKKAYDILDCLDFLYLFQKVQQIFIILPSLDSIEKILILFYHPFYIR